MKTKRYRRPSEKQMILNRLEACDNLFLKVEEMLIAKKDHDKIRNYINVQKFLISVDRGEMVK